MSSTRLFPFVTYLSLNFAWVCCIISTQPYCRSVFLKRTLELAHFDTSWMSLLQFMSLICRWSLIIHFVEFALFQPSGVTLLRARGMSWPYPLVFWGAGWEGVGVSVGSKRFPCVIACVTPSTQNRLLHTSEFPRRQMPAGKEPLVVSEPLWPMSLKITVQFCAAAVLLLIKVLGDSKPFPQGEGRNHLPRAEASSLNWN